MGTSTPLTSRLIVSTPGSLFYPLAAWVNSQLQIVAAAHPTYLKDSYTLKQDLTNMDLPNQHRYQLFTADAVSMYTNIPTAIALQTIGLHLETNKHIYNLDVTATMEAFA
jgi:hypothetical protein